MPALLTMRWFTTCLTIALLATLAIGAAPKLGISLGAGLLAVASAGLVWMASFDRNLICPKSPLDSIFLWLGSRSYSLYLTHIPTESIVSELRDRLVVYVPSLGHGVGVMFVGVCCLIFPLGVADLNYRFVETPLRLVGRRLSDRISHDERRFSPRTAH